MEDLLNKIKAFGSSPEGMARVRLGRGVVGNTTYAFIAFCALLTVLVLSLKNDPWFLLATFGLALVVFLIYFFGTYLFADKHPREAMLGDAEYLAYIQSQTAGKGISEMPTGPVIEAHASEIDGPDNG